MATENLSPAVISRLMGEIRDLVRRPCEGVEYVPNEDGDDCVSEVHAVITGPEGTPYARGRFLMKVVIGPEYPAAPPKGYFLTKIYHPNVASNGDICVNTLKRDWTPDVVLKHVFQVIRCLLIVPFPESSLNDEAGKLFMDSYDEFARRARILTEVHAMSGGSDAASTVTTSSKEDATGVASAATEEGSATSTLGNVMITVPSSSEAGAAPSKASTTKGSSSSSAASSVSASKKKSLKRL